MIRPCKWCKKEQEMEGKKKFCPGRKCKNAWVYANRTGKLKNKKKQIEITKTPDTVKTIVGLLTKVSTTADQCVRIQVDIPVERVTFDTIQHLNQKVVIGFVDETKEDKKDEITKENNKDFD
jgi:preprotein translocase subunit YajC